MILAIVGTPGAAFDAVLSDLNRVGGSRMQTLCLDYLTEKKARLTRLEIEANRVFKGSIKVITGIKSNEELNLLRKQGALVAHVYGAMGTLYNSLNVSQHEDFFISASMARIPKHVITAPQLVSEGELRLLQLIRSPASFVRTSKAGA